jgi:hypothetical protein
LGRYLSKVDLEGPPPPTYVAGEGPRWGGGGGPTFRPKVQGGVVRGDVRGVPWGAETLAKLSFTEL